MSRASILTAPLAPARTDEAVGLLTVDAERRLPNVAVIGAGADAGRELAERLRAAIGSTDFPRCRLVVTLPGDTSRTTSSYDLPAALAILHLETPTALAGVAALGELSLAGDVRPVRGLVGRVRALLRSADIVIVPARGADVLVDVLAEIDLARVRPVATLDEARRIVSDPERRGRALFWSPMPPPEVVLDPSDLAVGLLPVLRALAVGAALRIPVLGCDAMGIVAASRRLPAMLPAPSLPERIQIVEAQSAAGLLTTRTALVRPFRAPHHTVSEAGLRSEMDLARHGVLLLDEVEEFRRADIATAARGIETGDYALVYASRSAERGPRTPKGLQVTAPRLTLADNATPDGLWWQERIAALRSAPCSTPALGGRDGGPALRGRLLSALAVLDGMALSAHEAEVDGWLVGFQTDAHLGAF